MNRTQQIQQRINMFQTLFYVCLGLCIILLIFSVIFFFKFGIRNIFNARTGRSVRKTVRSMAEKNAHTGPLKGPAGKVRKVNIDQLIQPAFGPTEVLRTEQQYTLGMETQVLGREEMVSDLGQIQKEAEQSPGSFRIEKHIMLTHTDEAV